MDYSPLPMAVILLRIVSFLLVVVPAVTILFAFGWWSLFFAGATVLSTLLAVWKGTSIIGR